MGKYKGRPVIVLSRAGLCTGHKSGGFFGNTVRAGTETRPT